MKSTNKAFSLVELSIVLVILGLLIGGILAGKSLIKAAELRSVSRDFQRYTAAMYTFRDKYFGLPGDITNATDIWGLAAGTTAAGDATCNAIVSTDATTCNGNGDGSLGSNGYEHFRAWQQLANAGLVEGSYTGVVDAGAFTPTFYSRLNSPAGRIQNSIYVIGLHGGPTGTRYEFASLPSQASIISLEFVKPLAASGGSGPGSTPFLGAIGHEDAWNIDTKMDDGVADKGKVRASFYKATGTTTITDMSCLTYDLTNTTNTCALAFIIAQ